MISKPDDLPSDLVSALAALRAEREARLQAEAVAASARAELSDNEALIAYLELRKMGKDSRLRVRCRHDADKHEIKLHNIFSILLAD